MRCLSGQWQYLRWFDDGGAGGDDDADDREGLPAVWAAVLSTLGGDCVARRGRDDDGIGDLGDDGTVGRFVVVALGPGGFAAGVGAVSLA